MRAYQWMLCGAFAFACMGAFAHGLEGDCDWRVVTLARALLATIFAGGMVAAAGVRPAIWGPPTLWLRSIAGSVSMLCTFYALPRLPVAQVLTLANLFPVWVALLSWPLLGEKPSGTVWLAIASAIGGVALVQYQGPDASHLSVSVEEASFAAFVVLGGSFATALAMIGLHRLNNIDVRAIVAHFSAVATLFCLASLCLAPAVASVPENFALDSWGMLLGVGTAATAGQLCLTKAFTTGNAAKVSVVTLTQIGFAMFFDFVLWGRRFTPLTLAGMALVVIPTAWLMWQESRAALDEHPTDEA